MCSERTLFSEINLEHAGEVTVANGNSIRSAGKGSVKLIVRVNNEEKEFTLLNVLWVPELEGNLVSVPALNKRGFIVKFTKSGCAIQHQEYEDDMRIADFDGKFFTLNETEKCFSTVNTEKEIERCVHEWHRRLAHRNLRDIRLMAKAGLKIKRCNCTDDCEMCLKGKMSRKPFPQKATPTEEVLDCIVSDLCGPMQVDSVGRKKYFATFIDAHTGYCEVEFLREKSEATKFTIEFIERVKTQLRRKPKIFRTDQGGEYNSNELRSYLKKEGIKFQCTVGYAPEQNGIAERKNRTLMEAARSMMSGSGLPKNYWAEAVNTANHVLNRITNGKTLKTPYEEFTRMKPRTNEFYEFGCDAYVMIPYERRRKLDDKATKMKFVGYDEVSKGFRMTNEHGKITVSREVHFLDTKTIQSRPEQDKEDSEFDVSFCPTKYQEEDLQPDEFFDAESDEEENEGEIQAPELPRYPQRQNRGIPPARYGDYELYQATEQRSETHNEPKSYKEAMKGEDRNEWLQAMEQELSMINEKGTWELVDLPIGRKAVGSKWVFKLKSEDNGKNIRRKARLVAQGFTQQHGVDYEEVFAPVTRGTTMKMLLSLASKRKYDVKHFDITSAFLNGKLEEEIFMKQPPGFCQNDQVYRLKKSIYGLKQAAHVWNQTLHQSLMRNGCKQSETDKCLYTLTSEGDKLFLLVHVDDILMATNSEALGEKLMESIGKDFELKDLGRVKVYLGIETERETERDEVGNFSIAQTQHIDKIILEAGLAEAKISKYPMDTGYHKLEGNLLNTNNEYRRLIGMLLYLSTNSRPDIASSVAILSQRVSKPRDVDLNEVKRVIRYLKGTRNLRLCLSDPEKEQELFAYSDADWGENKVDRKSHSGYFCSMNGGAISWTCRKQSIVALSSAEAEYVALTETCKELMWIRRVAKDFGENPPKTINIFTDSQSAMAMINNRKFSNRTKHIDTKFHFVQDQVANGEMKLTYHPTETNIADMMTKPLGSVKIKMLRSLGGLEDYQIEKEC